MDPLQGCHQVGIAGIAGVLILLAERGQIEVSQYIQAVVYRNYHGVAILAHVKAVIRHMFNGRAGHESAAMQPYQHGLFSIGLQALGPDVQIQAVLVHRPVAVGDFLLTTGGLLLEQRADKAVRKRVLHALPRFDRLRGLKALSYGIAHSIKYIRAVQLKAADFSSGRLNNGLGHRAYKSFCHVYPNPPVIKTRTGLPHKPAIIYSIAILYTDFQRGNGQFVLFL